MGIALLAARLVLAAVFLVAGLAKLADQAGSRQAIVGFGLPDKLAPALAVMLPLGELAVAMALVAGITAWWGAVGALTLLCLFIAGIGVNLARGRKPDCHCFGQLHSAPIGWSTLMRNGLLAALAGFVVWRGAYDPGPSATAWMAGLTTAERLGLLVALILLTLIALEGWFGLQLLSQQGRLLLRLDAVEAALRQGGVLAPSVPSTPAAGLPVGTPAPDFELPGLLGERPTLRALRAAGQPVLLIFADPGCGPCLALMPEIGRWQRDHASVLNIAVVSRGDLKGNQAKAKEHGLRQVLLQEDTEVGEAYRYGGTPSAVLIDVDGRIASPVAGGADSIRGLLSRALNHETVPVGTGGSHVSPDGAHVHASGPPVGIGQPAPAFALPDLRGEIVDLAKFRGQSTLVLFWNPSCGFCQDMLEDLKAWERKPQHGAPRLLVISTGSVDDNRAMRLSSSVVLDSQSEAMRAFGANGTPMAVLVDAEGKIASPVVAGAQAVLALARGKTEVAASR